jgi:hypothetical protein
MKEMNTLLDHVGPYNERIFPIQVVTAAVAIILVALLFILPGVATTILLKTYLSIIFGWIGVALLFLMGDLRKRMPFIPFATAAAYFPLAIIFILDIFSMQTAYEISRPDWRLYVSLFMMVWGVIIYPVTGYLIGHRYPRVPLFGAMPCPTNIFTIGVLTAFASSQLEMIALFILSSMAVIAAIRAAVIGFDGERIYEDLALLASGIYGFVMGLVVL